MLIRSHHPGLASCSQHYCRGKAADDEERGEQQGQDGKQDR